MKRQASGLDRVQHWMLAVISHPDGVVVGVDAESSRQHINARSDAVEEVICRSQSQTAIERLQVYANAYYARLIECFHDEYPALRHALGDVFDGFVIAYLQDYPPQSYTLAHLAKDFPKFLRETRPEDVDADLNWPDFLIDLATLERMYAEVFDAPGPERVERLRSEDLFQIAPERWPDYRLMTSPGLRLVTMKFPVHEYASAVRRGETPEVPVPRPTRLVISREDYVVRRRELSRIAFALLGRLIDGKTIGEAFSACLNEARDDELTQLEVHVGQWFEKWTHAGFFSGLYCQT
ncbi:MAG: DNA-binding domain-containing protein [Planctomycetaceae bacterium]